MSISRQSISLPGLPFRYIAALEDLVVHLTSMSPMADSMGRVREKARMKFPQVSRHHSQNVVAKPLLLMAVRIAGADQFLTVYDELTWSEGPVVS